MKSPSVSLDELSWLFCARGRPLVRPNPISRRCIRGSILYFAQSHQQMSMSHFWISRFFLLFVDLGYIYMILGIFGPLTRTQALARGCHFTRDTPHTAASCRLLWKVLNLTGGSPDDGIKAVICALRARPLACPMKWTRGSVLQSSGILRILSIYF